MINFLIEADLIKKDLITWRRHQHKNPELGFEEVAASKYICKFLESEGIPFKVVSKTGIVAFIKGQGEKTIALRADIDALPIEEKNQCEYKSDNPGKMHACGHDAHTAILMGVAKILNKNKKHLEGNVKLFFEPAEETVGGARFMIKEGVLENPRVDAVIGLHVSEDIDAGSIGVRYGAVNAASSPFTITIRGQGGHGAHPDATHDPIIIAANVVNALQTLVSREVSPLDAAVVTIGSINGGTAENIIPEEVILKGIIRAMQSKDREFLKKRLKEVATGIALALRGSAQVDITDSYPCLFNDDGLTSIFLKTAKNMLKDKVVMLENPSMGVESFAYFANERPSVFYFLGARNVEKGIIYPAHSSRFDVDEDCLTLGVALQCSFVFDYLTAGGNINES